MNVALLRSINLGSHKKVAMDDLREVFSELGFSDVRSFLQPGNVIFRSQSGTIANLERLLKTEVDQRLSPFRRLLRPYRRRVEIGRIAESVRCRRHALRPSPRPR